jgi:ABC-type multidrug transport system fused ATPase/permease subunit
MSYMSFVFQDVALFNDAVTNNICYNVIDKAWRV